MNARITDTIFQTIEVKYRFPVSFTAGLFHLDNPTFADTLVGRDTHKKHRLICIVDDGVAGNFPKLIQDINCLET